VIAITSMIGCNTKIVAGIFDMFNFMLMSLQVIATTCNSCSGALLFYFTCTAGFRWSLTHITLQRIRYERVIYDRDIQGGPKKVSHYQKYKKCVKSYKNLPIILDFFVKLNDQAL